MNEIKAAVNQPEQLTPYIENAVYLYGRKEDGARFGLDELSHGDWACLAGIREGFNRAREQKTATRQAAQDAQMKALLARR